MYLSKSEKLYKDYDCKFTKPFDHQKFFIKSLISENVKSLMKIFRQCGKEE